MPDSKSQEKKQEQFQKDRLDAKVEITKFCYLVESLKNWPQGPLPSGTGGLRMETTMPMEMD